MIKGGLGEREGKHTDNFEGVTLGGEIRLAQSFEPGKGKCTDLNQNANPIGPKQKGEGRFG